MPFLKPLKLIVVCLMFASRAFAVEGSPSDEGAAAKVASSVVKGTGNESTIIELNEQQTLTVQADIAPVTSTVFGFHRTWESLKNLRVHQPALTYSAVELDVFLPKQEVTVGAIWPVDAGVSKLLKQLHRGATLKMHIDSGDSSGAWATLKSLSDKFAEVSFRIHGEFKLKDGYFTPSQFSGTLVVDRKSGNVVFFKLFVPPFHINFDVNHDLTANQGVTDAGFCPTVEMIYGDRNAIRDIQWRERISDDMVAEMLARKFYRAWSINWVPFTQALATAKRLKRPLHVVSADGPFKDESC